MKLLVLLSLLLFGFSFLGGTFGTLPSVSLEDEDEELFFLPESDAEEVLGDNLAGFLGVLGLLGSVSDKPARSD